MSNRLPASKALQLAMDHTELPEYNPLTFRQPKLMVIRLPGGWRIPFDAFLDGVRLSERVLILFIKDSGELEIEHFDRPGNEVITGFQEHLTEASLISEQETREAIQIRHPQSTIETIEKTLRRRQDSEHQIFWRVVLRDESRRTTHYIGGSEKETAFISDHREHTRGAFSQIGRTRIKPRSFSINLTSVQPLQLPPLLDKHLPLAEIKWNLSRQWTLWVCLAHITEFMNRLGYNGVSPHNLDVEYVVGDNVAEVSTPTVTPILSLSNKGAIAKDVTVLLHELAHVIEWFFFTRPPQHLDLADTLILEQLLGIQEGFADYLSATLLFVGETINIGALSQAPKLQRPVDAIPFEPLDNKPHTLGRQWASLLWSIREEVGADVANFAIMGAHLRPLGNTLLTNPFAFYLSAIQFWAEQFPGTWVSPAGMWDDLKQQHALS